MLQKIGELFAVRGPLLVLDAKRELMEAAARHDVKLIVSMILHSIATSPEDARLNEINRVCYHDGKPTFHSQPVFVPTRASHFGHTVERGFGFYTSALPDALG